MGTPLNPYFDLIASTFDTGSAGDNVRGCVIKPFSNNLTNSTCNESIIRSVY